MAYCLELLLTTAPAWPLHLFFIISTPHLGLPYHGLWTPWTMFCSAALHTVSRCPITHVYLTVDMIAQVVEELLGHIQPAVLDSAR